MNNNYYDLAEEDITEAIDRYKAGKYNKCAYWCQQSGEKYLKYILLNKLSVANDAAASDHNLKRIYECINKNGGSLTIPISALYSLTNYYYKARYPGEGFVEVDKETAYELLEHAKTIKTAVDKYITTFTLEDGLQALESKYGSY